MSTSQYTSERSNHFLALNREILIRAAVYMETEGSIQINRFKSKTGLTCYALKCVVCSTSLEIPDWLKEYFGGSICKKTTYGNRKQAYDWTIGSKKGELFLSAISPFMLIKQDQVALVLEMRTYQGYGMRSPSEAEHVNFFEPYFQKMHELNKRGK